MKFDFIVIGSGLAGLIAALVLQKKGSVVLITKSRLSDNATNLAQGGICCVVEKEDSFEDHIKDTMIAGAYHNDRRAVEYMVRNAPAAIEWLVAQGVRFEKRNEKFAPTREAAHSHKRVLHATDFTGAEIERALMAKVRQEKNICVWENCFTLDLLVEKNKCFGVQVVKDNRMQNLYSRGVFLATGGLGQIYQWTTNPKVATGDGIAMAERIGAKLKDLEFIQFHPTALRDGQSPLFLLSEALRGEGAHLIRIRNSEFGIRNTQKGERFMEKYDLRGEMAPRDMVARAIFQEQQKGFYVYLDIRHKGERFIKRRFPNIYRELKKRGFDLANEPIPVTPAAHYSCGGINVDLYGRTSINNLFAFGEVACNGVHGANRLASNSLLEAVVFPLRLNVIASLDLIGARRSRWISEYRSGLLPPLSGVAMTCAHQERKLLYEKLEKSLKRLMWEKVGIVRTRKGMREAFAQIKIWEGEWKDIKEVSQKIAELKNMLAVARLVTTAALKRKKSLGAHFIRLRPDVRRGFGGFSRLSGIPLQR